MKKQFLWAALAAVTLFGSSCNNDDPNQEKQEGNEVTFVVGGINSRTTTNFLDLSAEFEDGDKIGLFGSNLQTEVINEKLTYTGSSLSCSAIKFTDENTEATFKAYYPYQEENNNSTINFTVKSDQSDLENFNASDFLVAKAEGKKGDEISLDFYHKMALIKLTIDEGFTTVLNGATITGITLNAIPSATCDFTVEEPTATVSGDTKENIQMYNAEETYYCIVPAQSITGDGSTNLITITTDNNKAYAYKLGANKTIDFVVGKTLPITIMDGNSFKFYSVNIDGWEDITGTDMGVEEEEPEPEILLETQTFDNTTITSASNWSGSTGAWSFTAGTNATVQITTEASNNYVLNLKSSEEVKASWAQCVAYYTIENPQNTLYKISFKAKTDDSATKGLCFSALYKTTSNYVAIYNAPKNESSECTYTGMIQNNVVSGSDYKEYSIIIDLTKTVTSRNTDASTPSETTDGDLEKIFFALYPATGGASNNVNFYVDDLKIEQIFTAE